MAPVGVALWIEIDQHRIQTLLGEAGGERQGGCGFGDAAFLMTQGNNVRRGSGESLNCHDLAWA